MKYLLRVLYLFWLPLLFLNCLIFIFSFGVLAMAHLALWVLWIPFSWILFGGFCNADQFLITHTWGFLLDGPGVLMDFTEKFRAKCL